MKLERYTNFNFQSDLVDSKSMLGYMFTLNGEIVSWKSFKQQTVADSITKTDYITTSEVIKEVVWMKTFIIE